MHSLLAFAPAVFFGLASVALTTWAVKLTRRPVRVGEEGSRRAAESTLVILVTLGWLVCLVCVALGFFYVEVGHIFDGWTTEGD